MKISYTYRGKKTDLCLDFGAPLLSFAGEVVISQRGWTDGNQKIHKVTINADELLKIAKACLQQLSEISGVEYRAAVSVDGGNYRIMERTK